MKRVIFDLVKNDTQIVYPDDISLFSNTVSIGNRIVADYVGNLDLEVYLEDAKIEKIKALHSKYQAEYDAYLAQYPVREVATFATKQAEATAYTIDNSSPTPSIDAMVGGDQTLKVELINAIMAKVTYLAQQEGEMVAKRDAIKACTTLEELEAIAI